MTASFAKAFSRIVFVCGRVEFERSKCCEYLLGWVLTGDVPTYLIPTSSLLQAGTDGNRGMFVGGKYCTVDGWSQAFYNLGLTAMVEVNLTRKIQPRSAKRPRRSAKRKRSCPIGNLGTHLGSWGERACMDYKYRDSPVRYLPCPGVES